MNTVTNKVGPAPATELECDFPLVEISRIAELESWRKEINRPIYHIQRSLCDRGGADPHCPRGRRLEL